MKKFYFLFVIAVVAMMASCEKEAEQTEQTPAQQTEEKEAMAMPENSQLKTMQLGQELALYGYENESVDALVEAANILSTINTADLNVDPEKGEATADKGEKKAEQRSFLPADLLAKAKELAGEDANLLAWITASENKIAAASEAQRGALLDEDGKVAANRVDANSWVSYTVEFAAGEVAECAVVGDGDTDLDLYIYDANGDMVAHDADFSDVCYCTWKPAVQGKYKLKVINRGDVYNNYIIAVN